MLQIRLLGQFDVRVEGQRVVIPSRAGQSLFAYLVYTAGTLHRREKLAGLLWSETSDEQARRYLRNELWRVRKVIQRQPDQSEDYLIVDEYAIGFNPRADYWLDAAVLQASADDPDALLSNLALYQGELLPGFYEEWVLLERERLRAFFEHRMQSVIARLVEEQRWRAVLEWSEKWIALGQTPEAAFRALMTAFAATGNRAQVTATYVRCREALTQELGVEPANETTELYEQILRGEVLTRVNLIVPIRPVRLAPAQEPPAPGDSPFKGLEYFDESDVNLFFGREDTSARLAKRVQDGAPLTVVVGASGSGKSSFVRAGLIPALKRIARTRADAGSDKCEPLHILVITPTAHPIETLATALTREQPSVLTAAALIDDMTRDPRALYLYLKREWMTASTRNGQRCRPQMLVVLDQFEEIFTLCRSPLEREQFIDNVLYMLAPSALAQSAQVQRAESPGAGNGALGVSLVLTLRADFYAHLADYEELRALAAQHQEYIGPLTSEEMRRAIEEPARQQRAVDGAPWEFERGLVDLILRDVGSEPGALPLLSHALLETWKRRSGHTLTFRGYQDAGGVRGAIAQTAETIYLRLSTQEQEIARNVFLRLTELGEGTEDTRRRATPDELTLHATHAAQVRRVLAQLAEVRLLTMSEQGIEVAHEALIREWQRLREWLNQDREGLRLHHQLTRAAQEWELVERDPEMLYRGMRLAHARDWAQQAGTRDSLNAQERAFLAASDAAQQAAVREKQAQQERELETAKRMTEAAQRLATVQEQRAVEQAAANRRLRQRALFLIGAFLVAIVAALTAAFFLTQSNANLQAAAAAQLTSESRRLAAESGRLRGQDLNLALLLAVQAIETDDNNEVRSNLFQALINQPQLATLYGHTKPVTRVAYSPDGTLLASASADDTIRLWEAENGKLVREWNTRQEAVNDVAFSPDGTLLASAGEDRTIRVWDVESGAPVGQALEGHGAKASAVAFSPDGKLLASSAADRTIRIWDVASRVLLYSPLPTIDEGAMNLRFSPDGKTLAMGSTSGDVGLWDVASGTQRVEIPNGTRLTSIAYSPNGKFLAVTNNAFAIRLMDATTGQFVGEPFVGHTDIPRSVAFSPDGKILASASEDRTIRLWDVASRAPLGEPLRGHTDAVYSIAFHPNGRTLASAGYDGTVRLWGLQGTQRLSLSLRGHKDIVNAIAYSPDGKQIASASRDGTVRVWDVASGEPALQSLEGHRAAVSAVAYSPDGTRLASASIDKTIRLWDTATGNLLQTLRGHSGAVQAVAFSPDGKTVASGGYDNTTRRWDVASGKEIGEPLRGRTDVVNSLAFSPDGKTLAAGTFGVIWLWDLTGDTPVGRRLDGHTLMVWALAFSPDGKTLASGSDDKTIRVWDVESAASGQELRGHLGGVFGLAFSPDGKTLASASQDRTVWLWNVATGQRVSELPAHRAAVRSVAYSPDGKTLASAGDDLTIRIWQNTLPAWQETACRIANRNLTRTEWAQYVNSDPRTYDVLYAQDPSCPALPLP